jgi:hypothetical protein
MNLKITFWLIIVSFVTISYSFGQFDRKATFSGIGGYFVPVGEKLNPDSIPYVFPNFQTGLQIGGAGEYNLNQKMSAGVTLLTSFAFNYKDPIPISSAYNTNQKNSYFFITSLGTDFKYKFLGQRNFTPYTIIDVNLNLYNGTVEPHLVYLSQTKGYNFYDPVIQEKYTLLRYNARKIKTALAMGFSGAIGFDLKISHTFVYFLQTGYNLKFTKGNDVIQKNIHFINFQSGLRFSFFREKSLL